MKNLKRQLLHCQMLTYGSDRGDHIWGQHSNLGGGAIAPLPMLSTALMWAINTGIENVPAWNGQAGRLESEISLYLSTSSIGSNF